jgi:methylenetetrahydrofolate reductase (NADPH)
VLHELGAIPVPHVPVRCVRDRPSLQVFLDECVGQAGVREILLIAGDYPHSIGPFSTTMDVLQARLLVDCGIDRLSVAGHPEGHPLISPDELRRAEREKIEFALNNGVRLTFLTQFFFGVEPFLAWQRRLPIPAEAGDRITLVAGLAGPAKLTTLLRYAAICGVGASMRALSVRPTTLGKVLTERGPESIVRALATQSCATPPGIHLFSFGGLTRTLAWLAAVEQGRFQVQGETSFLVRDRE